VLGGGSFQYGGTELPLREGKKKEKL